MASIVVRTREGFVRKLDAKRDQSVMDVIRDAALADPFAICGGSCSCATCHVYVDPAWLGRVPPIGEDEKDLLSESRHCRPTSRLSCQILLTEALDGLAVTVAPADE